MAEFSSKASGPIATMRDCTTLFLSGTARNTLIENTVITDTLFVGPVGFGVTDSLDIRNSRITQIFPQVRGDGSVPWRLEIC
jgi:hypothetical protein